MPQLIGTKSLFGGSQIVPPCPRVPRRLRGECLGQLGDRHEPTPASVLAMGHHISHRTTVDGHHEGLALGHPAHDRRVVVAQLRLPYHRAHSENIAFS